jgi:glycogen debranching enzyme
VDVSMEVVNLGVVYAVLSGGEATGEPPTGVYYGDTRVIGKLRYTVAGRRVQPDSFKRDGLRLVYNYSTASGEFTRTIEPFYWGVIEHVKPAPHGLRVIIGPDFSDIFEVRGMVDRGALGLSKSQARVSSVNGAVHIHYRGVDMKERGFSIQGEAAKFTVNSGVEVMPLSDDLTFMISVGHGKKKPQATYMEPLGAFPTLSSDNAALVAAYESGCRDLFSLLEKPPSSWFPLAGVPYFNCVFGRDAITVGLQTLVFQPKIALDTIRRLSTHIGRKYDAYTAEEPGKVVHEVRTGELSGLLTPFKAYYGSVDATALFVALYYKLRLLHPKIRLTESIEEAVNMSVNWVASRIERDGLLGYFPGVLRNQGWKDSDDSVFHADGSPPTPPIFLVEPQGYADLALRLAAQLSARRDGEKLMSLARKLRERITQKFWWNSKSYFGEALDGNGRLAEIVTSNPGHLLWSGSIEPQLARRVASILVDTEELNSNYGVKTLGFGQPRHQAESYHNGSIWPHDNSLILRGLSAYGLDEEFQEILGGFLRAYVDLGLGGFPEHYSGVKPSGGPPKPLGCYPQAWSAGAIFLVVQSLVGLDVELGEEGYSLHIKPHLPAWIGRLKVGDLHVLGGALRLEVERVGHNVKLKHDFVVEPRVPFRLEVEGPNS